MKIEEFMVEKFKDLREFHTYWLTNHFANPQGFPLEMGPPEFNEQFQMWKDFVK